mmetsp:Transcript_25290/g.60898  ORF Transcript_25290/g.60898 Transcript_25290/m.60898 type:complete len:231 (-) Transcript_25290:1716-2408(-)
MAMNTVRSITGKPTLKKSTKEMWEPSTSALDAMTMLAEAPMRVPLPPKHAPKARAQARGRMETPSTSATSCWRTGTIVAVKGMLSTKAEKMAEAHTMMTMATICRLSTGTERTISERMLAMARSRPSSPTPSTTTKRAAKKRSVSHSTAISASWQWCMSKAMRSQTAPRIETKAGSTWVTGCRKKHRMTHPSTTPHFTSSPRFVMGYVCWSVGTSASKGPLRSSLKMNHR